MPNGTNINLFGSLFFGETNFSFPSSLSQTIILASIFSKSGNYTFVLKVFENSTLIYKKLIETVLPAVAVKGINGPNESLVGNTSVYSSREITGGRGPYNYTWYVIDLQGNSYLMYGKNISLYYNNSGTYKISLYVFDSLDHTALASMNTYVYSKPKPTVSYQYNPVDVGVSDEFKVRLTVNLPIIGYEWFIGDNAIPASDSPTINYTFFQPRAYNVSVRVYTQLGYMNNGSIQVVVYPAPQIVNFTQEYSELDYGITQEYWMNISSGYFGSSNEAILDYYLDRKVYLEQIVDNAKPDSGYFI